MVAAVDSRVVQVTDDKLIKLIANALRVAIVTAWIVMASIVVNVAINAFRSCPACSNLPAECPR